MGPKKYFISTIIILIALTAFRIYYAGTVNLCYDEAYNWEWSQRLAPDYYSEPGMVGWVTAFFVALAGHTETGVRLGAIIFSVFSSLLIFWLAKLVTKKDYVAFLSVFALQFSPLGTTGGLLMMHDVVTMPFWLMSMIFLWKVVETKKPFWWYAWAPAAALALSGKMSSVLLFLCTFLFFILSNENRIWLKRKEPYLAALAVIALFSHNIIWNITHNFTEYKHITGLGSAHQPELLKTTVEFIGSQALLFTPIIFFIIAAAFVWALFGALRNKRDGAAYNRSSSPAQRDGLLFLVSFSLTIFIFFLLLSLRSKVEANWTNIGYPAAYILLFTYLSEIKWKKPVKIIAAGAGLLISLIFSTLIYYPSLVRAIGINYTSEQDRTNEIYGWDYFGREFSTALQKMPANKERFIFGPDYQITSIVRFYTPGRPQTYCLPYANRRRNQYDIWGGWDALNGKDGVFVYNGGVPADIMDALLKAFKSVRFYADIPIYRKEYNEPVRVMKVYYCSKFLGVDNLTEPAIY